MATQEGLVMIRRTTYAVITKFIWFSWFLPTGGVGVNIAGRFWWSLL